MKNCKTCLYTKELYKFGKDASNKDGLNRSCKKCLRQKDKNRYFSNKVQLLEKKKEYKKLNRVKCNESHRKWMLKNKEKMREYYNIRRKDPIAGLAIKLRVRLRWSVKNTCKAGSAVKDLGCTIEFLKAFLESKFKPGMTWDNWGNFGWHIDHIRPLSSFDLTDRDQLLKACHYTNLQPLWWKENLSKGSKLAA
jgi:hypothetical protein